MGVSKAQRLIFMSGCRPRNRCQTVWYRRHRTDLCQRQTRSPGVHAPWERTSLCLRCNYGQSHQRVSHFLRRIYHTKKVSGGFPTCCLSEVLTHSAVSQAMGSDHSRTFVIWHYQRCEISSLIDFRFRLLNCNPPSNRRWEQSFR